MEFRPGRYVKVTTEGKVLGRAAESEIRAWFSVARGGVEPDEPPSSGAPLGSDEPQSPQTSVTPAVEDEPLLGKVEKKAPVSQPLVEPAVPQVETRAPASERSPGTHTTPHQIAGTESSPSTEAGLVTIQRHTPEINPAQRPPVEVASRPRPEPLSEQVRDLAPQVLSAPQREAALLSLFSLRAEPRQHDSSESTPEMAAREASDAAPTLVLQPDAEGRPVDAAGESPDLDPREDAKLSPAVPENEPLNLQDEGATAASAAGAAGFEVSSPQPAPLPVQVVMPLIELNSEPGHPGEAPALEPGPIPAQAESLLPGSDTEPASARGDSAATEEAVAAADEAAAPASEPLQASIIKEPEAAPEPELFAESDLGQESSTDALPDAFGALPPSQALDLEPAFPLDEGGPPPDDDDDESTCQESPAPLAFREPARSRTPRPTPGTVDTLPDEVDTEADPEMAEDQDNWLWVDPRYESGYHPATFDVVAFLQRAVVLYQTKAWSGARRPGRVVVHPEQLGDGLEEAAEQLGLALQTNPTVGVGTFRLGASEVAPD